MTSTHVTRPQYISWLKGRESSVISYAVLCYLLMNKKLFLASRFRVFGLRSISIIRIFDRIARHETPSCGVRRKNLPNFTRFNAKKIAKHEK